LDKEEINRIIVENALFFILLVGVALVTCSIGPYQNWDTGLEFEASSNIIKIGVPYTEFFHGLINQPPLGFYLEAAVFHVFGLSLFVGQILVALFGLGTVVVVYSLGKELYGKTTGLFAAALFALSPWQLILSRSFLVDAQCLFLSLLCLYIGVIAIRKNSVNLTLAAGVLFAAAFMTKLYAAFMILPLLMLFLYSKPKNIKQIATRVGVFTVPVVVAGLIWYQIFLGTGLLSIIGHHDFNSKIPADIVPSYFFVLTFLNDYGIGFFFLLATIFSMFVGFSIRKQFPKIFTFDLICVGTIGVILGINLGLVVGWNLNVPYISAIKYDYQALPFFCFIVASLAFKSILLFKSAQFKPKLKKTLQYMAAFTGAFLLVASLLFNMMYANGITMLNYLLFRVQRYENYGFGLFNYSPISANSPLMILQYVGIAIALSALLLASRHAIVSFFKPTNPK
jgi:4-amino-4-deoxy-L-arabinose transferase-like glycosyltransferase